MNLLGVIIKHYYYHIEPSKDKNGQATIKYGKELYSMDKIRWGYLEQVI